MSEGFLPYKGWSFSTRLLLRAHPRITTQRTLNGCHLVTRWGVGFAALACAAGAQAQGAVANHQINCKPIPYTVGEQLTGGEIAARFGAGALGRLNKTANLEGRAGVEIVRTAYAGMTGQAMSAVLAAFGCRIKASIKDTDADAEKNRTAVDLALSQLNLEIGAIQDAATGGDTAQDRAAALKSIRTDYYGRVTRDAAMPSVDSAIVNAVLDRLDEQALFINQTTVKVWAGLKAGTFTSVQGCGGVVKAAISDGGSSLQASLLRAKVILASYLDRNQPPTIALSTLYMSLSAVPKPSDATKAAAASFKECSKSVTAASAAPVAASAPIAPASAAAAAADSGATGAPLAANGALQSEDIAASAPSKPASSQ